MITAPFPHSSSLRRRAWANSSVEYSPITRATSLSLPPCSTTTYLREFGLTPASGLGAAGRVDFSLLGFSSARARGRRPLVVWRGPDSGTAGQSFSAAALALK